MSTWYEKYATYEESLTGSVTGLTAFAGGGQASATALTGRWNSGDTCASNFDSYKAAAFLVGKQQWFFNNTTKIASVYPQSGEYINNKVNAEIRVFPGEIIRITSVASGKATIQRSDKGSLRHVVYTVGVPGATGVDHTFTSVANNTEQSIQLGSAAWVPAKCPVDKIIVICEEALNTGTGTSDVGTTSGGAEYISAGNVDALNEIIRTGALTVISASASSVYFSLSPSANFNALTTGKWRIIVIYNDVTGAY